MAPRGKVGQSLKSTRWMIYRAQSTFQPVWMRRKDFFTSPKDLAHKLGCWQGIKRWRELRTTELGFPKLTRKSKKWPSSIAVQRVHKAKASLAVAIQQHKANTGGSASRKCSEVAPVQGRDPLAQWQCQSSELGRAGASQPTKVLH